MWERELTFANEVADRADALALAIFAGDVEVRRKPDDTPVTEADVRIEQMVRESVAERFPADAVLGEEAGAGGDAERVWIVDPIDATQNFASGIQIWGTLLALRAAGDFTVAVVSAPGLDERYEAVRGEGARLNGRSIRVSDRADIAEATVAFADVSSWTTTPHRDAFLSLLEEARRTRGFGDFWAHMLVARGSADVMLEPELNVWDWAAPTLIVEEAGGQVSRLDGGPPEHGSSVVSTNGRLHDEMLRRFGASGAS